MTASSVMSLSVIVARPGELPRLALDYTATASDSEATWQISTRKTKVDLVVHFT